MISTSIARYRMRALMAASSVGLLVGASIGAACLGGHLAHEGSAPRDAARLLMASRDGKANMAALDANGGAVDQSALNIAMRFSQYAGTGTDNSQLAQNLTAMRTSDDAREQRGLPDGQIVLASNITPASPLSAPVPSVRAAAAMKFTGANKSDSDCLTQAVYYEARGEGTDGMRAVAQVILNRVRHPAYPKSICGVVYQGAYQRTSCQFSFVCNGAMGSPVESWAWRRAKTVADAALSGYVMSEVGTSTSFHTTGVKPGWGSTMERVAQVGSHIFYQFRGRGSRLANSIDGVQPSMAPQISAPQTAAPATAAPVSPSMDAQTVAMLNSQSKMQATAATRPVQVSAQIHGKSAQDIIAEVSLPKSAPVTSAAPVAATPAKAISQ